MTKVIKGKFEKLETVKVNDVSLTCDTSLEIFHDEFNRLSRMHNDLFTYEIEVTNIPCDLNRDDDSEQQMLHEDNDDMGGDDKVELTDEESSDNDDEVDEVFRINTNVFGFETPMYVQSGLPVAGEKMNIVMEETYQELRYELKEEALRNKAIMEGLLNEDVESNDEGWKSWDDFENTNGNRNEWEYKNQHEDDKRHELCGNETHELPVCNIRRFEMIKYSVGQDEEYVDVQENKYKDLTSTSEDACQAYQEIFCMMDEGWMDFAEKKSTILVKYLQSRNLEVLES
ncbi:hypothetical protein Tco_0319018 [Tanacetum coccineum]